MKLQYEKSYRGDDGEKYTVVYLNEKTEEAVVAHWSGSAFFISLQDNMEVHDMFTLVAPWGDEESKYEDVEINWIEGSGYGMVEWGNGSLDLHYMKSYKAFSGFIYEGEDSARPDEIMWEVEGDDLYDYEVEGSVPVRPVYVRMWKGAQDE